jgi:hypothetical protein
MDHRGLMAYAGTGHPLSMIISAEVIWGGRVSIHDGRQCAGSYEGITAWCPRRTGDHDGRDRPPAAPCQYWRGRVSGVRGAQPILVIAGWHDHVRVPLGSLFLITWHSGSFQENMCHHHLGEWRATGRSVSHATAGTAIAAIPGNDVRFLPCAGRNGPGISDREHRGQG